MTHNLIIQNGVEGYIRRAMQLDDAYHNLTMNEAAFGPVIYETMQGPALAIALHRLHSARTDADLLTAANELRTLLETTAWELAESEIAAE